jgi:glycosyltransferase involved in cell wall biosynthesis
MARAVPGTHAAFAAELPRLDAVLVFGPHPLAVSLASAARRSGVPVVLGVRQDYRAYIRHRLPGPAWAWAVPVAAGLERVFRSLARDLPTVALGAELARRYAGGAPVLETGFSLVGQHQIRAPERNWCSEVELLSVGRLDPEKDPLLLLEVLARLRRRSPRWRLTVAGDGALRDAVRSVVAAHGLEPAVSLLGHVPNGPQLWDLYRRAHALVHVSRTEGLPQVLVEAHAAGLPIVATDVGGVGEALGRGTRGLLVAPGDAAGVAGALERLAEDPALRDRLSAAGLRHAHDHTMERELDRLAGFLRAAVYATPRRAIAPAAPASATSSHR